METKLKINDEVEVIDSEGGYTNKIGDIGIISEVDQYGLVRVSVKNRVDYANWHLPEQLKLITKATT